jgi:serine protease
MKIENNEEMPIMRRLMLLLPLLAACADDTPVLPSTDPTVRLQQAVLPVVVEVKLRSAPDPGGGVLRDEVRASAAGLAEVLDGYGAWQIHRLVETPAAGPAAGVPPGEVLPHLSAWYQVVLPGGASAQAVAARLRSLAEVEHAYPMPLPAPPPATPSLTRHQGYYGLPRAGTAAFWAHNLPGGRGDGVTIVDVEYDWYFPHEDLLLPPAALISGERYTAFGTDHGTAVLGMLVARDNGFGMTGGVPNARALAASPVRGGLHRPAEAIAAATAATLPGDVILIELQTTGPDGKYVPLEWIQSVFEAVRGATTAGRVVVAAAGNGGADLNDTLYHGAFDRTIRDSGALLVGAGNSFHSRIYWSSHGARVDLQGWGDNVATTGYGGLYGTTPLDAYTSFFSGTSSAAPMVAAAVAAVQGRRKAMGLPVMTAAQVRQLLRETGSPQQGATAHNIGPFPDLDRALLSIRTTPTRVPALAATPAPGRAAALSWPPATGHAQYVVQRRLRGADGVLGPAETVTTLWAVEQGYLDTDVVPGAVYRYQISACDPVQCSGLTVSPLVAIPVLPAAPSSMAGTLLSSTSIRVAWRDGATNESGFQLWRRERPPGGEWSAMVQVAAPGRNVVAHTDAGRVPGTAYMYRVHACNLAGCSSGVSTGTLVAPIVPATPGPLVPAPLTATSVQVSWTDRSTNETHFEVHRRVQNPDGVAWTPQTLIAGPRAGTSVIVDRTVTEGTRYLYYVRACNGPACSPWVTSPRLLMPVFPPVPGSFRVVSASATGVRLSWTDGGTSETGFRLERRTRNADGTYAPWAALATAPANGTGWTDAAVVPGGRYLYRIGACNGAACSAWTAQVSAAVPAG